MKQHITEIATLMIHENGLINLSRAELCERAKIPDGSFINTMGCTFIEFVEQLKNSNILECNYPVVKSRTNPALRRRCILQAAIKIACKIGYTNLTRSSIAEKAGVSEALVSRYFGTMVQMKRDVMRYAIHENVYQIVAQGLAINDKHAAKAPQNIKDKAAELIKV